MSEAANWEEFFEYFSYKPNWEFMLSETQDSLGMELHKLHITMRVPNSRTPLPEATPLDNLMGKKVVIPVVPVTRNFVLPLWYSEEYSMNYVRGLISALESHEQDEWFKYKGELPFDPHKER